MFTPISLSADVLILHCLVFGDSNGWLHNLKILTGSDKTLSSKCIGVRHESSVILN